MSDKTKNKIIIQGNVNKLIQIDKAPNVNIQQASPEVGELIKQGLQLIKAKSWDMAIEILESAKKSAPTEPDCYYYLSFALLKGRRPKVLDHSEAVAISDHLQTACNLNGKRAHYYYLWALIKSDFFLLYGFDNGEPTVEDLMDKATDLSADQKSMDELVAFLSHIEGNAVYAAIANYT